MKNLFYSLFVFVSCPVIAQNCDTSLLFKKGAQLEYRTYLPKTKLFSRKPDFFEVTRLTFYVDEVKDSNNVLYSFITKKGVAASSYEKDHYEKKYVITCENGKVSVPVDFYAPDTMYLSDMYPDLRKGKYYTASNNRETVLYKLPLNNNNNRFELSAKTVTSDIVMRDFGWEQRDDQGRRTLTGGHLEPSNQIEETKYTLTNTFEDPRSAGKTKINVPAGSYDSDKYIMAAKSVFTDVQTTSNNSPVSHVSRKPLESSATLYFNPKVGLVKTENSQGGYTELSRVKR